MSDRSTAAARVISAPSVADPVSDWSADSEAAASMPADGLADSETREGAASPAPVQLPRPTVPRLLRDQRKVVLAALVVAVVCFWIMGPLGKWQAATLTSVGVGLALLNHLVSEFWLARIISSGADPSRGSMAGSAFVRLAVLAVVAVGLAALFWPDGVGLLLGLALFRLIALVMTVVPLLKELKKA